jgi:hypothetical protein
LTQHKKKRIKEIGTMETSNVSDGVNGCHRENLRPDLQQLWAEKFDFNKTVLGLDDEKAAEWADRTIEAHQEAEKIFGEW